MNYKDLENNLHFLDSAEFEHLLPVDCVQITDDEAETIRLSKVVPLTYSELRAAEYPDYRLYLDGIVKGDQAQIQSYIDACLATKSKYPKGE
jgi:hypothetical protein